MDDLMYFYQQGKQQAQKDEIEFLEKFLFMFGDKVDIQVLDFIKDRIARLKGDLR